MDRVVGGHFYVDCQQNCESRKRVAVSYCVQSVFRGQTSRNSTLRGFDELEGWGHRRVPERQGTEVGRPQSHVSRDDRPISGSLAASLLRGYPRAVAARSSLLNCVTRRTVSTASPTASYTPTSVLHLPVPLIARRCRIARARTARHSLSASDGFYSGVDHRQFRRARKKEKPSSHAEHRIITILSLCLETTTDSLPTVQFPCRK